MLGAAILAKVADLRLEGLVDSDEVPATLLAAAYAEALRTGRPPRSVLDAIWKQLPDDDLWDGGLRAAIDAALDAHDAGVEAEPT